MGTNADELAKQTQNPVASLISVPLQGNWDFGLGDRDATGTLLNIQPVMPFGVSQNTNLILRVIMPLTSQPGSGGARINGLGDIVATAFFSPTKSGRIIWGAGPVFLLPAATNARSARRSSASAPQSSRLTSPAMDGRDPVQPDLVGERRERSRRRQLDVPAAVCQLQPRSGLSVGVSMEATGNWEADEAWTAPLLFNVSKVTLLGKRPVSFTLGAGPHVASPDGGADWRFRLAATFLFPR